MKANKTVTTTAMVTFTLLLGLMAGKLAIKGRAQTAAQNAVITYTLQQREVITTTKGELHLIGRESLRNAETARPSESTTYREAI